MKIGLTERVQARRRRVRMSFLWSRIEGTCRTRVLNFEVGQGREIYRFLMKI